MFFYNAAAALALYSYLSLIIWLVVGPEELAARRRRKIGVRRDLEAQRDDRPHPSVGGSLGYEVHWRESQIEDWRHGRPFTACLASIRNWRIRLQPFRQTGNKESENVVGTHQLLLVLYLIAYPSPRLDEVSAFIANTS